MHNCQKRGTVVFFRSFKILQAIKSIHYQNWHRRFSYLNIFLDFGLQYFIKFTHINFLQIKMKKKEKNHWIMDRTKHPFLLVA